MSGDPGDAPELAPRWHTALLASLILAVAIAGTWLVGTPASSASASPASRLTSVYLPVLLVQWGLAFYVCRVGRRRNALRQLLGQGWDSAGRALCDLALGASFWCFVQGGELLAARVFGLTTSAAREAMLPASPVAHAAWLLVAVSVGFCEELVYRGYLRVQLGAFTGSARLGVALQAALFGVAHAEQGLGIALRFAVYGLLLGALAGWRKSLIPGVLGHVALDMSAAFLR